MSSTQLSNETTIEAIAPAATAEKFEVTTIPVADVDRAKAFYLGLGWRLDIDFEPGPGIAGRPVHAARLPRLDPVRQGHEHDDRARPGPVPGRRRHRGRP